MISLTWEQSDFWEQPYSECSLLLLQEPVVQGGLIPPHEHPQQHALLVLLPDRGRGGGTGAVGQAAQGPPQMSAGRAGTHGPWEEHRGIFPASFPACVGVASHHGGSLLLWVWVFTARMVGPQPRGSPCCTTGCRREVLPWRAAELRWKKAVLLRKRVFMLPSRNGREMSSLSLFISGTGTSSLSADSLDLFLGLVVGCNGHDDTGP